MDDRQRTRDEAISQHVIRLQERYPQFARARRTEMRLRGYDPLSRAISEHVWFGNREAYEKMLMEMLTDEERELLRHDPNFTEAWRVFMDLRWIRKHLERFILMAVAGLLAALLVAGLGWTFYQFVISLLSPRK